MVKYLTKMALYLGNKRMNDMYYTIGQVAKMQHLTISQIRYYDKQGLFPFLQRNEKGDRVFDNLHETRENLLFEIQKRSKEFEGKTNPTNVYVLAEQLSERMDSLNGTGLQFFHERIHRDHVSYNPLLFATLQ